MNSFDINSFLKEMKEAQKNPAKECEYKCSKYCLVFDFDMPKENDKYCCKACYNCAKEIVNDE